MHSIAPYIGTGHSGLGLAWSKGYAPRLRSICKFVHAQWFTEHVNY